MWLTHPHTPDSYTTVCKYLFIPSLCPQKGPTISVLMILHSLTGGEQVYILYLTYPNVHLNRLKENTKMRFMHVLLHWSVVYFAPLTQGWTHYVPLRLAHCQAICMCQWWPLVRILSYHYVSCISISHLLCLLHPQGFLLWQLSCSGIHMGRDLLHPR